MNGLVPDVGRRRVYREPRDTLWPWHWMVRGLDGLYTGEACSWGRATRSDSRIAAMVRRHEGRP